MEVAAAGPCFHSRPVASLIGRGTTELPERPCRERGVWEPHPQPLFPKRAWFVPGFPRAALQSILFKFPQHSRFLKFQYIFFLGLQPTML